MRSLIWADSTGRASTQVSAYFAPFSAQGIEQEEAGREQLHPGRGPRGWVNRRQRLQGGLLRRRLAGERELVQILRSDW